MDLEGVYPMKNFEQYKRIVRFTSIITLVVCEMAIYWTVWLRHYNIEMEIPYNRTGNWMIVAVYCLILLIFSKMYGGLKIGYLKTFNIIYSQFLTTISANALIYLQITLLIKHFTSIVPLVYMTVLQLLVIVPWGIIFTRLYRFLYPARKALLVYGERTVDGFVGKANTRNDRFIITKKIDYREGVDVVVNCAKQSEAVILCDLPSEIRNTILKFCYSQSIRVYVTPKLSDIIIRSAEDSHLIDSPLLLSRNNGFTFEQRFFKRAVDIVLTLALLFVFSPIMIVTALAIKLYDRGPVLFLQERYTKGEQKFMIYKFRSMKINSDSIKYVPTMEDDPRVTPVGKVIRQLRIDEMPQFFNILKGEMSLIGPRAESVKLTDAYVRDIPEFKYRLKVKSGLTGYAQVHGKYNTTPYDKLKLDLMYIQNYSWLMDMEIIFLTVKILFMKDSTEGFTEEQCATLDIEEAKNGTKK
ncbi:exopolysaccharide biosynthesis polyprenyl glycosylphosphotransferase [Enterocloster clostridioformis]|uniref:exopolysaccharide biosynthesis polyprenyl glycosylphosphotransferase n=2 Tax=Enterocloster clostridioformis TaxID=1531 RepID=UPI001CE1709F|nr:exopolysaccharide biosynthesis polyprenyl glycosylphosphotransferase [Enterocloster clostridioformis]MCA5578570.1 exopolysaccharide biosynthesis polyprenyl glycosylphosphotransferase [Enterocloster clostridioformis]